MEAVTFGMEVASVAHLWGLLMSSNPMGPKLVANATEEQRAEVKKVLEGKCRERTGANGRAVLNVDINEGHP